MTGAAPIETPLFDPVAADIDQLDLTDSLIVHSALRSLQDEVRYWRENMACYLQDVARQISAGQRDESWDAINPALWKRFRDYSSTLDDALSGDLFAKCESCGGDIRPGDKVIFYSDVGEGHAVCAGATAQQIAAGRLPVPLDSLDLTDLTEEQVAAARADPSVSIYTSAPFYTAEKIREIAEQARAMIEADDAEDDQSDDEGDA